MTTEHVEVAVIGGGAMGLATAWELTRRGRRPVVFERFARGHTQGASHGATRNFNNAYGDDHYLDLLDRARAGWEALSTEGEEPLLRLHGLVTHGAADLGTIQTRLIARGVHAEMLAAAEAAARWPGMRFDRDVLYSRDAGVVRASAALIELERRIIAGGGDVRWETPVERIDDDGDGVRMLVAGRSVHAEVAVVTAGAWTSRLLPDFGLPALTVTEETPAHFRPHRDVAWPSFNHYTDPERYPATVYGMPTPGEGVKVGFHQVGDEVDPDARPHRTTHAETLRRYVAEWMPGLDPESAAPISCTYTSTDDSDFILDRRGDVVVGAGFSGHGFKFVPGIGAQLADLALDRDARSAAPFLLDSPR